MYTLNAIFIIPVKPREDKSMIAAYEEVYNKLEGLRHKPQLHILDNKYNKCIQNFMEKKGAKRHHVAPHNHRVNAAEPAVKPQHIISLWCWQRWIGAASSNFGAK